MKNTEKEYPNIIDVIKKDHLMLGYDVKLTATMRDECILEIEGEYLTMALMDLVYDYCENEGKIFFIMRGRVNSNVQIVIQTP